MIAFIKGTVDSLSEGKMILESHGIGYELNIPASIASGFLIDRPKKKRCLSLFSRFFPT